MEQAVAVHECLGVAGPYAAQHLLNFLKTLAIVADADLLGREACGKPLQHLANLEHVLDLAAREALYSRAAIRGQFDEAGGAEMPERLAHRATADADLVHQVARYQALAGGVLTVENPAPEVVDDH